MKFKTLFIAAAFVLAGCGTPPVLDTEPLITPSTTVEQANARIAAAAAEQARIENEYAAQELVCYKRFFVNDCLDLAKEQRRVALIGTTARDNEAQHFLRKHALEVRDAEIAKAEADFNAKEAGIAVMPPREPRAVTPLPPAKPSTAAQRKARQAARQQEAAARAQADAPKRAANVAEAAKRKADAAERQKVVAQRLADRQADQARKAAEKAAADAADAAAAAAAAAKK